MKNAPADGGERPRAPAKKLALRSKIATARLFLAMERFGPVAMAAAAPLVLFSAISLFDLWRSASPWLHWAALIAALAATACVAARLAPGRRWPSRREAMARLERDGEVPFAAVRALHDAPFNGDDDDPLWRAHLARMAALATRARLAPPTLRGDRVDPFGLRYPLAGLFAVALLAGGSQALQRAAEGFAPPDPRARAPQLVELWIEPPAYTGKAPIYLIRAGAVVTGEQAQVDAPEGAKVVIQDQRGRARLKFATMAGTRAAESEGEENAKRRALTLDESGYLTLRDHGRMTRWPVGVVPDREPSVRFTANPSTTDDASLALAFAVNDDYGVVSGALTLRLDPDQVLPLDAPDIDETILGEARTVTLDGMASASGERVVDVDLQADPWAGLAVIGSLTVRDAAGQTGRTEDVAFRLPERAFYNPLAKAVIEQRRTLAVSPDDWRRAEWALSGLTLAPEAFYPDGRDYLLLRTAMWRVAKRGDEDQAQTVDDFWPLALQLEDEALDLARRRLEAAQDALREALENGAGDDEIERLTEELRAAMQDYLQAFAQSGQQMQPGDPQPKENLEQADLDQMLDQVRDLAKSGAQNAARQALSELENILDNLRMSGQSRPGGEGGQGGQPQPGDEGGAGGATGKAGDLIGRQRDLANRSFERGQDPGAVGGDLAEEQSGIAGDVESLLEELRRNGEGLDPGGEAGDALGRALGAMGEAREALGADEFAAAGDAMERAISELRDGAEAIARAAGEERRARQAGRDNAGGDNPGGARDPLGRPIGDNYGDGVEVPGQSDAQRSRDILEKLRERLSDGERSEEEVDYLERLLERF